MVTVTYKTSDSLSFTNMSMIDRNMKYIRSESPEYFGIFEILRGKRGVDIQWVKENVYGTQCLPEKCPRTRGLKEIILSILNIEALEEGEIK